MDSSLDGSNSTTSTKIPISSSTTTTTSTSTSSSSTTTTTTTSSTTTTTIDIKACFCNQDSEAKNIDVDKVLIFKEPALLAEFSSTFGFHKIIDTLRGARSYNLFTRDYIDGYRATQIEQSKLLPNELNDMRSRNVSADFIRNNWPPIGPTVNKVLQATSSPYKLKAIVYRPDLFEVDSNGNEINAGEFRFLFDIPESLAGTQMHNGFPIKLENHVIFEFKLPLDNALLSGESIGAFSREDWAIEFGKLNCLTGEDYNNHLSKLAKRVAYADYPTDKWVNGSALGQLRIADFLQLRSDQNENANDVSWGIFEFRLDPSDGRLHRHRMPKTPKDNYSDVPEALVINSDVSEPSPNGSFDIMKFYVDNFFTISDPELDYKFEDKHLAWHLEYQLISGLPTEDGTNWGKNFFIKKEANAAPFDTVTLDPHLSTYAMYRTSLNTCNSCHSGAFNSHQPPAQGGYLPTLAETGPNLQIDPISFQTITNSVEFVHIQGDGTLSPFIQEDLELRKDDLQFFLGVTQCMGP